MAWFILIGPGVAEFTHFVFPVLKPGDPPGAARNAFGDRVERPVRCGDANYYLGTTGTYYFPGLYTAVLPMIPGIWAIVRMVRSRAQEPRG